MLHRISETERSDHVTIHNKGFRLRHMFRLGLFLTHVLTLHGMSGYGTNGVLQKYFDRNIRSSESEVVTSLKSRSMACTTRTSFPYVDTKAAGLEFSNTKPL